MKIDRKNRKRYFIVFLIVLFTFLLASFFLTFIINIEKNKGIIPLIFLFIAFYSFFNLYYYSMNQATSKKLFGNINNYILAYFLMFLVNLFFFVISDLVLWQ